MPRLRIQAPAAMAGDPASGSRHPGSRSRGAKRLAAALLLSAGPLAGLLAGAPSWAASNVRFQLNLPAPPS
jgi:hypothetical protein